MASAPIPCTNLGVQPPSELAALYRRASAGVVFSLTTHSLVAQEMMASGLPLVELNGDNVASALGKSGGRAMLVDPRPDAIADALGRILDEPGEAAAMARRARAFVESVTWERAATRWSRRSTPSWPRRRTSRRGRGGRPPRSLDLT